MKRKLFIAAMLALLCVASIATKFYFPEPGITNFYFVPIILCLTHLTGTSWRSFTSMNLYKEIVLTTIVCVPIILIFDLFDWDVVVPKLIFMLEGGLASFIVVFLYKQLKPYFRRRPK